MERIKDWSYTVKEGMVVVMVYSLDWNTWKYVTTKYFENNCVLVQ